MNLFLNQLLNRWFPAQHFKVKRSKKKFKVQLRDISPSEKENSIFSKHETMFYWWKHTYHRVQTRKNIDLDGEPTDHIFPIKKTALVWLDHSVIAISRNNFFFSHVHPSKSNLYAANFTTLLKKHTISENYESRKTHIQAKSTKATNLRATAPNTRSHLNGAFKGCMYVLNIY